MKHDSAPRDPASRESGVLCAVCEERQARVEDPLCAECRADVEAVSDTVNDPVERVLSTHGRMEPICTAEFTMCRCGAGFSGGPGYHRRHLAERIYDALGIPGPAPWQFGSESPSRERFGPDGRVKADV